MSLIFNTKTKTYQCDHMDFEVNEDGEVVVTLIGQDFIAPELMTVEEVMHIVNDPIFVKILRLAYDHAMPGTPLRCAFDRMNQQGGTVVLRFEQSDTDLGAAA